MLLVRETRLPVNVRQLGPAVRRGLIDNSHGFQPWSRWLDTEQARSLAALDSPPEFLFGGDQKVLVERVGVDLDLDPFAAAGDNRERCTARICHPHIVLQLGHML